MNCVLVSQTSFLFFFFLPLIAWNLNTSLLHWSCPKLIRLALTWGSFLLIYFFFLSSSSHLPLHFGSACLDKMYIVTLLMSHCLGALWPLINCEKEAQVPAALGERRVSPEPSCTSSLKHCDSLYSFIFQFSCSCIYEILIEFIPLCDGFTLKHIIYSWSEC